MEFLGSKNSGISSIDLRSMVPFDISSLKWHGDGVLNDLVLILFLFEIDIDIIFKSGCSCFLFFKSKTFYFRK